MVYLLLDILSWLYESHDSGVLSKKLYLAVSDTQKRAPINLASNSLTKQFEGKLDIREGQDYGFISKGDGPLDRCFFSPGFIESNGLISGDNVKVKAVGSARANGKPRMDAIEVLKKA